ncbi:MAG: hypothetical protein KatS3mg058_3330 [Roseiflexus sp.]|nr:MAG: hypothetical protein KatS3mg058_3330 [Roseiflexus sp.]
MKVEDAKVEGKRGESCHFTGGRRQVGVRHRLARMHEYVRADPERLYELLSRLDDFRRFVEQIRGYVS